MCKAEEYDCEYNIYAKAHGIFTITKGSSRRHYILTEKGLKQAKIKEGEPVAYNMRTKLAVVEEATDSSIEIFVVDTENGETISSGIELPIFNDLSRDENGRFSLLQYPTVESGCITDDGTVILLVSYVSAPILNDRGDFLFVYEKGDAKKVEKYVFPDLQTLEKNIENRMNPGFEESPLGIQCGKDGSIYLFSAKIWGSAYFHEQVPPVYALEKLNLTPQDGKTDITPFAFVAFNGLSSYYYSEKDETFYAFLSGESGEDASVLRTLKFGESEIPDEIIKKSVGRFIFSGTEDGRPLVFFLKDRNGADEEQRLELLDLQF